jgi:hypothetical protein
MGRLVGAAGGRGVDGLLTAVAWWFVAPRAAIVRHRDTLWFQGNT